MAHKKQIEIRGREYVYDIRRKIADNRMKNSFPRTEDYGISEDIVDDYLYELMDGPQSVEEQKKVYTRYGICFILPICIVALMKQTMQNFLLGVGSGLMLCGFYYLLHTIVRKHRLQKLAKSGVVEYIEAIEQFSE